MSFVYRMTNAAPSDYETPPFPSLYWPFPVRGHQAYYLYDPGDVWRFTLLWTLIFYGAVHVATSGYAIAVQWRNWKVIWIIPVIFCVIGGIEAVIAGSIVGGLLGGVYSAGYYNMSTWIPFVWGLINTLVLILSSFAIQGAL
ncbi:putative integral membrane protein [Lasiodiplodia theobromae]|uniref:Integral membrane protein n=2 Tax=Lasiodiplodia TaxID=66739 RepID=A0A5N5DNI4_9PEZI|nr:Integral membrane protein [Lasiodiplodia theobromae]KAB2578452.1 Uncharacterized protein DBV05_g3094 [Lasiodiplodia theobromae]KAF4544723.1 Integral membrane protein [Lasiodiplodia theobromae]KAF9637904.1 putative integral membrane protein [Lasiodiplodia theobromae]KAK0659507.1 Uncharacterized protein DIS24_g3956 [Lasiodiplodia hormozganensis]